VVIGGRSFLRGKGDRLSRQNRFLAKPWDAPRHMCFLIFKCDSEGQGFLRKIVSPGVV
jgi:hypothetical protein